MATILLFLGAGGLLIASAVFSAKGATELTKVEGYRNDEKLKSAHSWISWGTAIAWIGVALIITLIVLYIIFASETAAETAGFFTKFLLLSTVGLMITTGIFCAIGASKINSSASKNLARKGNAYSDTIWATVLALIGATLVGGLFIYKISHKPVKKNGKVVSSKEAKEEEKLKLAEEQQKQQLEKQLVQVKEQQLEAQKQTAAYNAAKAAAARQQLS